MRRINIGNFPPDLPLVPFERATGSICAGTLWVATSNGCWVSILALAGRFAAQTPVSAVPLVSCHCFVDPNEGSFSMDVPACRRISGGLARRNALQFWPWLTAVSPDGNTILAFGDPSLQSYISPNQMLAATGFGEGSGGGGTIYVVSRYLPGLALPVLFYAAAITGLRSCDRICLLFDLSCSISRVTQNPGNARDGGKP